MNKRILLGVVAAFALSAAASNLRGLYTFVAPSVADKDASGVKDFSDIGTIIYDRADDVFFGRDANGWTPLSAANVSSTSAGLVRIASSLVTNASCSSLGVSREDGDWIVQGSLSCSSSAVTVPFVSGTFAATPNCQCTVEESSSASKGFCVITATSSSSLTFKVYDENGTPQDRTVSLLCIGTK